MVVTTRTAEVATAKLILMSNKTPIDMIRVLETHMISKQAIHILSRVLHMEDTVTTVRTRDLDRLPA